MHLHAILARHRKEQIGRLAIIAVILDHEGLEHLCRSGKEIPFWQSLKHLRADIRKFRLADNSENVFVSIKIDACLATDRGIDLSKQGRRNISKTHSPLIYAGSESGHVSGNSATDCQNQSIPVGIILQKPGTDFHHGIHGLGLF